MLGNLTDPRGDMEDWLVCPVFFASYLHYHSIMGSNVSLNSLGPLERILGGRHAEGRSSEGGYLQDLERGLRRNSPANILISSI